MGLYDDAYELKKALGALIKEELENNETFKRTIKARKATVTTPPSAATGGKVRVQFPMDETELLLPYNTSAFTAEELTEGTVVSVWYSYKINNGIVMKNSKWTN